MTRWHRPVRRLAVNLAAACALAMVSIGTLAAGGNWTAPPRFDGAGYAVLARGLLGGQGYRAIDHPDRPLHAHFPPGYPIALALDLASHRRVGHCRPCAVVPLHAGCDDRRMAVVSTNGKRSGRGGSWHGTGRQLVVGANRHRDPVRAAVLAAGPADDLGRSSQRPSDHADAANSSV